MLAALVDFCTRNCQKLNCRIAYEHDAGGEVQQHELLQGGSRMKGDLREKRRAPYVRMRGVKRDGPLSHIIHHVAQKRLRRERAQCWALGEKKTTGNQFEVLWFSLT